MLPGLQDISGSPSFTGGAGGDAKSSLTASSGFDSSGWVVNIGSGSASGTPGALNPFVIAGLALAGLIAWKLYLKS